jgi:hypothetical protein
MPSIIIGSGWRSSTAVMPMDHAQDAAVTLKLHRYLRLAALLFCLLMLGSASAQSNNLVRNPTGEDGLVLAGV